MTLSHIRARTASRKTAGAHRTYPQHADRVPSTAPKRLALPVRPLPCVHEGSVLERCHTCPAKAEGRHVRECDLHNKCTREVVGPKVRACSACADYTAEPSEPAALHAPLPPRPPHTRPPVGRRHLLYYVLPVSGNGVWQRGVDALRLRWGLFTGRKIIAVATGGPVREQIDKQEGEGAPARTLPLDPVATVRAYLPADAEVIEVENDPTQWERVGWSLLWERVLAGADEHDAVLYAHAKGVTRRPGSPCHRWADLLYTLSLGHWSETEGALRRYPVAGSLLKRGAFFGPPSHTSQWHYSGNFFWLRAKDAREKLAAVPVPCDRWGAEAWVGIAFPLAEAGEVFGPTGPDFHLYAPEHLDRVLADHAVWTTAHRPTTLTAPRRPQPHPLACGCRSWSRPVAGPPSDALLRRSCPKPRPGTN